MHAGEGLVGLTDRNRSIEKAADFRHRYAMQNPSPTTARREVLQYKPSEDPSLYHRDPYQRGTTPPPAVNPEKLRNIEFLQQKVAALEAKNKQLLETYSKNEKKANETLKNVKEDNQSLKSNLKKFLVKNVINSETLMNNPASAKFVAKLKEMKQSPGNGGGLGLGMGLHGGPSEDGKNLSMENDYIIQELRRGQDCRAWIHALSYSKKHVFPGADKEEN